MSCRRTGQFATCQSASISVGLDSLLTTVSRGSQTRSFATCGHTRDSRTLGLLLLEARPRLCSIESFPCRLVQDQKCYLSPCQTLVKTWTFTTYFLDTFQDHLSLYSRIQSNQVTCCLREIRSFSKFVSLKSLATCRANWTLARKFATFKPAGGFARLNHLLTTDLHYYGQFTTCTKTVSVLQLFSQLNTFFQVNSAEIRSILLIDYDFFYFAVSNWCNASRNT